MRTKLGIGLSLHTWPLALVAFVLAAGAPAATASEPVLVDRPLQHFLEHWFGMRPTEQSIAEAGGVAITLLPSSADKEIAVAALKWVEAPVSHFLEHQRSLSEFSGSRAVLQAGIFSEPPTLGNLTPLRLQLADIQALRTCRQHDCRVKILTGTATQHPAPTAQELGAETIEDHFKRNLLRIVRTYQDDGIDGLGSFIDKRDEVVAAQEDRAILEASPFLEAAAPSLHRYLRNFPKAEEPAANDLFYWSNVTFGLKPTIRLNHMVVFRNANHHRIPWIVAARQIYASHYFQGGLELRFVLLPELASGRDGFYLLCVNRSRNDGIDGGWKAILRRLLKHKIKSGMDRYMVHLANQLLTPQRENTAQSQVARGLGQ